MIFDYFYIVVGKCCIVLLFEKFYDFSVYGYWCVIVFNYFVNIVCVYDFV